MSSEYAINYQRELRAWAKTNHICPACKTQDFRTLGGRTYCEACAARYRSYHYKNKKGKSDGEREDKE